MEGDTAEDRFIAGTLGAQLGGGVAGQKRRKQRVQRWLGGGAEDCGGVEVADELGDGGDAGAQVRDGQHLRFIEDDDALGQVVELPAFGGTVAVDGLEELHRCGHHHRHIPILRSPGHPLGLRGGLVLGFVGNAGVVFQHVLRP